MEKLDYYWVDFEGLRIEAHSKSEVCAIVLRMFEEGIYPEIYIEAEQRAPLRACPVHHEKMF